MSDTISVRIQPLGKKKLSGHVRHDTREKIPGYVNRSLTAENSVLISPPDPNLLFNEIAENRKLAGQQKLRQDAQIAISGIVTFGSEAQSKINNLNKADQNELFGRVIKSISIEVFEGRSILSLVIHRDESAIHAHFLLRAHKLENGKEQSLRRITPQMLKKMQDIAGREVSELGIKRGKSKEARIADKEPASNYIHKTVRELHNSLPLEIEESRRKRDKMQKEAEAAEVRLSGLEKKIKNIENILNLEINIDEKLKLPEPVSGSIKTGLLLSEKQDVYTVSVIEKYKSNITKVIIFLSGQIENLRENVKKLNNRISILLKDPVIHKRIEEIAAEQAIKKNKDPFAEDLVRRQGQGDIGNKNKIKRG